MKQEKPSGSHGQERAELPFMSHIENIAHLNVEQSIASCESDELSASYQQTVSVEIHNGFSMKQGEIWLG